MASGAVAAAGAESAIGRVDYVVEGRPARLYRIADEYAQVELYGAYFSVAWSTQLPVEKSLAELADLLPEASNDTGTGRLMLEESAQDDPVSAAAVLHRVMEEPGTVHALRLEYPHFTLTWRAARESANGRQSPAQIGLIADVYNSEPIIDLIHRTATARVAGAADQIVHDAEFVPNQVPIGPLLAAQL
jgi:hypothetical protein